MTPFTAFLPRLVAALLSAFPDSTPGPPAPLDCRLSSAEQRWIESALAGWEHVRSKSLGLPDAPPPMMIFFNHACTFTLPEPGPAPRSLRIRYGDTSYAMRAEPHDGRIALPNRRIVEAKPATFASMMPGDTSTFLLIALEDVWARDPASRSIRESWSDYLSRVLVHEMTHARQFINWVPAARIAGGRVGLVDVDDDVVQQHFDTVSGVREAVRGETALLYEAAFSSGARQRELLRDAVNLIHDRRARFYTGAQAPWSEIEQLWLDLEGAGQWAALQQLRYMRPNLGARAAVNIVRESRTYWSQEEGLALFLALDAVVPGWQKQVFAENPKSSLELIEQALQQR